MKRILENVTNKHTFVPISAYNKPFTPEFEMWLHRHAYIELMYCESGGFVFEYMTQEEGQLKTLDISPYDVLLINSNMYHRIYIRQDTAHICNVEFSVKLKDPGEIADVVNVNYATLIEKSAGLSKLRHMDFAVLSDSEQAGVIIKVLSRELASIPSDLSSRLHINLLTAELFVKLGTCCESAQATGMGVAYINKAMRYIRENYAAPVTVDDVAGITGINKSYLQRLFKQYTGKNIMSTVNYYRVEKCKNLLLAGNYKIAKIAEIAGFENRQHCIYEFKRFTGKTPSQFRYDEGLSALNFTDKDWYSDTITPK